VLAAHRGISEAVIEELTAFLAQKGLLKRALKSEKPLIVDNLAENKDMHFPKTAGEGWRSVLCVPLKYGHARNGGYGALPYSGTKIPFDKGVCNKLVSHTERIRGIST